MTLDEELEKIPQLTDIGRALIQFSSSLTAGEYIREGKSWVYRPVNFIAFQIRHSRAKTIVLSLHGNWRKFDDMGILPISSGRNTMWSTCSIKSPRQLAAAARYIEQSYLLHSSNHRHAWKYQE